MENYNQHMIDQLVKVIPQDVLQKLQQMSAQDFTLQAYIQLNNKIQPKNNSIKNLQEKMTV